MMSSEHEIKSTVLDFLRAFSHLEWAPFLNAFDRHASVFFPFDDTPSRVDGMQAIAQRFRHFFDLLRSENLGPRYLNLDPLDMKVDILGGTAVVTFHLHGSNHLSRRTIVMVEHEEGWKIRHLHASRTSAAGDFA